MQQKNFKVLAFNSLVNKYLIAIFVCVVISILGLLFFQYPSNLVFLFILTVFVLFFSFNIVDLFKKDHFQFITFSDKYIKFKFFGKKVSKLYEEIYYIELKKYILGLDGEKEVIVIEFKDKTTLYMDVSKRKLGIIKTKLGLDKENNANFKYINEAINNEYIDINYHFTIQIKRLSFEEILEDVSLSTSYIYNQFIFFSLTFLFCAIITVIDNKNIPIIIVTSISLAISFIMYIIIFLLNIGHLKGITIKNRNNISFMFNSINEKIIFTINNSSYEIYFAEIIEINYMMKFILIKTKKGDKFLVPNVRAIRLVLNERKQNTKERNFK